MKRALAVFLLAAASTGVANPDVVRYEPAIVTLVGTLESRQGMDADGKSVLYPALELKAPVRVVADPGDELNRTEERVSTIQLVLTPA